MGGVLSALVTILGPEAHSKMGKKMNWFFKKVRKWKRDSYNAKVQKCLTGLRKSMTRVNDEIRYLDKENPLNGYSLMYWQGQKRELDKNICACLILFKYEEFEK